MKYCKLFGRQCFKNNLMPSVVRFSALVLITNKCGFYDRPSASLLQRLVQLAPIGWEASKHVALYFHRDRDADELVDELSIALAVFEA